MRNLYSDLSYLMCVIAILLQCASCFGTSFGEDNYIDSTIQMKSITEPQPSQFKKVVTKCITNDVGSFRGSPKKKLANGGGITKQILPLLVIPFLVSSAIIPVMFASIKILLIKSLFVGKIAVILMLLNFFRRRVDGGGVYNYHVPSIVQEHYGYQGIEEPGIYIHKRKRKRNVKLG